MNRSVATGTRIRYRKCTGHNKIWENQPDWERIIPGSRNQKMLANLHFCLLIKELISANGEKHRLYEENNNLDLRLKELSAEYTNRLQQYIHDIAVRLAAFHFP